MWLPTKEHADKKSLRERNSTTNTMPQDINAWNNKEYLFYNFIYIDRLIVCNNCSNWNNIIYRISRYKNY